MGISLLIFLSDYDDTIETIEHFENDLSSISLAQEAFVSSRSATQASVE